MKGSISVQIETGRVQTFGWDLPYNADRRAWVLVDIMITKLLDYAVTESFAAANEDSRA